LLEADAAAQLKLPSLAEREKVTLKNAHHEKQYNNIKIDTKLKNNLY